MYFKKDLEEENLKKLIRDDFEARANMKKEGLIFIGKFVAVFAITFAILVLVLFGSFALPIDSQVYKNVDKSTTGAYKAWDTEQRGNLDQFTNDIFVLGIMRSTTSKHPIFSAINDPNHPFDDTLYNGNLVELAKNQDVSESYGQYWHGWASWLRPMLAVFTYQQIQIVYGIIFYAMLGFILFLMYKRKMLLYGAFLVLAFLVMSITTLYLSHSFFLPIIVSLVSMVYILLKSDNDKFVKHLSFVFLVIGMLTSYVEILAYPVATYVFSATMVFLILRNEKFKGLGFIKNALILLKTGVSWIIGYAVFWVSKWVFFSSLISAQRLAESFTHVAKYTGSDGLWATLKMMFTYTFGGAGTAMLIICLVTIVAILVYSIIYREKYPVLFPLTFLAAVPIIWLGMTQTNANIHPYIIYKTVGILFFPWGCIVTITVMDVIKRLRMKPVIGDGKMPAKKSVKKLTK